MGRRPAWMSQMRKGFVDFAILSALASGEAYGYAILKRLKGVEGLEITESTLYPALSRLLKEGALGVKAVKSDLGPTRRYYRLTAAGRAQLVAMTDYWKQLSTGFTLLAQGGEENEP